MIDNITSTERLQRIIEQGNDEALGALRMISNPIQRICPSCMDELNESGGAVDQDALSLVTDQSTCDYDH